MRLPPTISRIYQGTAQAFQSSLRGMGVLLVLAVFVIYLVLGILYESFIHPLTILSGLPTGGLRRAASRCSYSASTSTCTRSSASSC